MRSLPILLSALLFLVSTTAVHGEEASAAPTTAAAANADDLRWLNRITYGANTASAAQLARIGRAAFLAEQLAPVEPSLSPEIAAQVQQLVRLQRPLPEAIAGRQAADAAVKAIQSNGDARRTARKKLKAEDNAVIRETQQRLLLRAVYSRNQLQEQMAWFWFNHFNVFSGKGEISYLLADYEDSLRPHLLGNFRDLLRASLTHAAMLQYLDNRRSKKGKINENYARELMELHTLGVDGGYTQKDVQELARVLTGLAMVPAAEMLPPAVTSTDVSDVPARPVVRDPGYRRMGLVEFNPRQHDSGDKKILGRTIAGQGWPEVEEVIDMLVSHPATAQHIARKLAIYFVDDKPSPALVERMAARFRDSDGNIRSVLETLFNSPEFAAAQGKKYKSSWQYVVSSLRALPGTAGAAHSEQALAVLGQLAQEPYAYLTPDGYSLAGKSWASPGQLETRLEFAAELSARASQAGNLDVHAIDGLLPLLSEAHRAQVSAEADPRRRLLLMLGSPEFMYR